MIQLSRTVRFFINPPGTSAPARSNTFAAWPPMAGISAFQELTVACTGEVSPVTGYFLNIKDIDEAVREAALPIIVRTLAQSGGQQPEAILPDLFRATDQRLRGAVALLRWHFSPYLSLSMERDSMSICLLREQFEFAAAHRLHCDRFSEEENRRLFGKCNNPVGHGHNYRLEVCVEAPTDQRAGRILDRPALEAIVNATIIERYDHRNLNVECPEFATVNPSVENIAKVCHQMLKPRLLEQGIQLRAVTVWESTKTSCVYSEV